MSMESAATFRKCDWCQSTWADFYVPVIDSHETLKDICLECLFQEAKDKHVFAHLHEPDDLIDGR